MVQPGMSLSWREEGRTKLRRRKNNRYESFTQGGGGPFQKTQNQYDVIYVQPLNGFTSLLGIVGYLDKINF